MLLLAKTKARRKTPLRARCSNSFATGVQCAGQEERWSEDEGKGGRVRIGPAALLQKRQAIPLDLGSIVLRQGSRVLIAYTQPPHGLSLSLNSLIPIVLKSNFAGDFQLLVPVYVCISRISDTARQRARAPNKT